MTFVIAIVAAIVASQSSAQELAVSGRMICDVRSSQTVFNRALHGPQNARNDNQIAVGTELHIDYTFDPVDGFLIYMGEPNRLNVLFEEQFPAASFKGISPFTGIAEYRKTYSDVSVGKYLMSYKGKDALLIKYKRCGNGDWSGHFTQHYPHGWFKQVVSLRCQPFVDAIEDAHARMRLAAPN